MAEKLGNILDGLNYGIGQTIKVCEQLNLWAGINDDRVKKNTEAVSIRKKVLIVLTSSSAWAQELTFLKVELIKKFNALARCEAIVDIKFSPKLVGDRHA
ncbi:hypothetical protein COT42_04205 [Candidatus Saganbacteria bacterium CG08_land_8_20_14_0_20_45_16]|uniref:DUF721 domain-containing protein n=1 Tax=Candidatus Saganbacteria bacterium CG08_land_8_20_14_0_20_45_16 TaxID=2014293 RepID=A0A2H0XXY1_UNCSA|nr:MAG: hypothetical protein COT42_04205 [Candidatus Saganbacteria bacterium CG08_land_8_20_14_0_20_45_16]